MNFHDMDEKQRAIYALEPVEFGLMPTDAETYIALAVKDYFIVLKQEDRLQALKGLMIEKEISRPALGLLANYATEMVKNAFVDDMEDDMLTKGINTDAALTLKYLGKQTLENAYAEFDAEKMSGELEEFLEALVKAVRS